MTVRPFRTTLVGRRAGVVETVVPIFPIAERVELAMFPDVLCSRDQLVSHYMICMTCLRVFMLRTFTPTLDSQTCPKGLPMVRLDPFTA